MSEPLHCDDDCSLSQSETLALLKLGLSEGETVSEIEFPDEGRKDLPVPVLAESESRDHVTDRMVGELPPMSVIKPEGRTTTDKREGSNEGHEYSREPRGGQFISLSGTTPAL